MGRGGEKHQFAASYMPPISDLTRKVGMCPDWESHQWSLGSQAGAQSTEPQLPGQSTEILKIKGCDWSYEPLFHSLNVASVYL